MSFRWSWALLGLLAIPVFVAVYLWLQRRKRKFAVRYSSLSLIREAMPGRSSWRRHLPFALLMTAAAALLVASARPQMTVSVSTGDTSIILALDVSRSMCATDVDPNRLAVAQEAARTFVENEPKGTRFGIVAFAGSAQIVVPPTADTHHLIESIDGLTTSIGTAIGSAVLASIDALAKVNSDIAPSTVDLGNRAGERPPGSDRYVPDIIVLLTDGANTRGVDPLVAAKQAADRRARVYTIGFGTTRPVALSCKPDQLGNDMFDVPFGAGGFSGADPSQFLLIDEPTLKAIADTTGGRYYRAENADQLLHVFDDLPSRVVTQDEQREVSVAFVALGAVLAMAAVGLSLWWNRYP